MRAVCWYERWARVDSTVDVLLAIEGGSKKKKKKQYKTPKKKKHKHKKTKLATLKYYKIDPSGKVENLKELCDKCKTNSFMAEHKNRFHCGNCGFGYAKKVTAPESKKAARAPKTKA
jgi:small subunit ribosomal protein S27Ae